MNLKLEIEFSKAPILEEVDALKKQIDDMRPLPPDVEGRVMQKLRLDWNYNSNAIEGNKLDYGETTALLMHGITAKGKPLKDHLDIQGHNDAINFLLSVVKEDRTLTEADIRALHEMILVEPYTVNAQTEDGKSSTKRIKLGTYKTSPNHVKTITGEIHYYATPEEIPAKMQELIEWYIEASNDTRIHPVITAALFHYKFVAIHPFDDGNGRLSRILMNLVLMRNGFPPVVVKNSDKQNYYSLLSQSDAGNFFPFVEYISEQLINSLNLYLKAINGGDVEEDEDIDKEIALFKKELSGRINLTEKKSVHSVHNAINKEIRPLLQKTIEKAKGFNDLFFSSEKFLRYRFKHADNGNPTSFKENILQDKIKLTNEKISEFEIDRIEFNCYFKEFRQADKIFNIEISGSVMFDPYKYSIYDFTSNKLIEKYYNETISSEETHRFVLSFISAFKTKINQNLEI